MSSSSTLSCNLQTNLKFKYNILKNYFLAFEKGDWNLSELEIVSIGNCQNRKLSELQIVRIGHCQNWKLSELAIITFWAKNAIESLFDASA